MDYKEKYEKALEWMKSIYPTMQGSDKEDAEHYFPELAESEDERMIIGLQGFLSAFGSDYFGTDGWQKFDDWLEKQKEQKPTAEEVLIRAGLKPFKDGNQWCILAGDNIQEGICGFGDTIDEALYQFLMEVLEKQKEQKPTENGGKELLYVSNKSYNIGYRDGKREAEQKTSAMKPGDKVYI